MRQSLVPTLVLSLGMILSGCGSFHVTAGKDDGKRDKGGDPGAKGPQANPPKNRVDWASVPQEFNPETKTTALAIDGVQQLNVDLFGFKDDVSVVYGADVAAGTGRLVTYSVYKSAQGYESATLGTISSSRTGSRLEVKAGQGMYACSIRVINGKITELAGRCYVRAEIQLPTGAEIEVFNLNTLISRRFFPMTTDELQRTVKDQSFADGKLKAIDAYLASFEGTGKTPALTANDVGTVVGSFSFSDDKFAALTKLQGAITDRGNIATMIDESFSHFDRPKARQIARI